MAQANIPITKFLQVGDFMTEFDYDCDGKMSFAEFQKAVEKLKELEEGL